jgi:MFS family permease
MRLLSLETRKRISFMALSLSVLKIRDFRLLLLTRMFTTMALQSQAVIVGWQLYSLTHSTFILGLTGLAEAVPAIICALFAGHIVDISRPHRVFAICVGVLALNTFLLMLIGGHIIPLSDFALTHYIFLGIFVSGLARSFIMPASFSLLPQIIARKDISAASAWLNSGFQVAAICGPAVAGLVYGGYGPRGAWFMPTSLLAVAFILINFIPILPRAELAQKRDSAAKSIKAGWAFILQNPVLLSVMSLDMFAVLFGGAVSMLPAYADQVLHVGSQGLGVLRASPALGAVIVALLFALKPMKQLSARRLLFAVAGFGICMIGFGLSTSFWLSMMFLIISGGCDSISVIIRGTLMQLLTPDHMRGRVSAVNSMFIISSNEIGSFESGTAARLLGLVPSVVFGGLMTLGVVAATAILSPKFRKTIVTADET